MCQNTRIIDWEKEKKERKKAIFSQGGSRNYTNQRANTPTMNSEVYQLSPTWTQAISTPAFPQPGGRGGRLSRQEHTAGFLLAAFDVLDFYKEG